jgi:hypothetical protein
MHGLDEGVPFLQAAAILFGGLTVQVLDQFAFALALLGVAGTTVLVDWETYWLLVC